LDKFSTSAGKFEMKTALLISRESYPSFVYEAEMVTHIYVLFKQRRARKQFFFVKVLESTLFIIYNKLLSSFHLKSDLTIERAS